MPSNTAQTEAVADIEPAANAPRPRFDNDDSGSTTAAGPGRDGSRLAVNKTLAHMASPNQSHPAAPTEGNSGDHAAADEQTSSRSAQQDGLLQVPQHAGGNRTTTRPVETSIWDWDTPLESVGNPSSSYHYEPQGELLQEQRAQRPLQGEFSIPGAVSGVHWPFPEAAATTAGSEVFAVPRRPTGPAGVKRKSTGDQSAAGSKQAEKRATRTMSDSGDDAMSPVDGRPAAAGSRSQSGPNTQSRSGTDTQRDQPMNADAARNPASSAGPRRTTTDQGIPMVLPARKVFPIQIGDKLFRLSGASISSDAPSYFSQFFEEQLRQNEGADNVRTLYIDRDPATFEDISLHLQGYHIEPRDGPHFVKLFADAQFFSLPRLTAQLFSSTIYIRIGDEEFQIPRDLFSNPGDSPNYFSLGFSIFFTTPNDVFPGLSERSLLRPPSILPPSVPNKSAKTFADLLHILKGYPVEIRSDEHRQELLRDARYFHLKGLEQRLIPHQISYNLARQKSEILLRLEDIRQSGITFVADNTAGAASEAPSPVSTASIHPSSPGWVYYQRPYIDPEAYTLIVEMSSEEHTFLSVEPPAVSSPARLCRATFRKQTLSRITSLFSVIASKMNLPITQPLGLMMLERGAGVASLPVSPRNTGVSEERVKCRIGPDADVIVDGKSWTPARGAAGGSEDGGSGSGGGDDGGDDESAMEVDAAVAAAETTSSSSSRKRRRQTQDEEEDEDEEDEGEEWIVRKAQWRLRVQPLRGSGGGGGGGVGGGAAGQQSGGRTTGVEIILGAVKLEAFSNERARNVARGFLT